MRQIYTAFAIIIGLLATTPIAQADQLKTGIIKTAPSPTQMTGTPSPAPKVPEVKTAPGVTTPVPTKQGITAPLGQKATIAVKSPTQGTQHPAGKPLTIVWDRSSISTVASVNILLMDKPGGMVQTIIKTGAANTGSFMSWIPSAQFVVPGKSWVVRIETRDKKSEGHSGAFSFAKSNADRTEIGLPQQNNQSPSAINITAQHTVQNKVSISEDLVKAENEIPSGVNTGQVDIMQLQINMLKKELELEKKLRTELEEKINNHIVKFESHVHTYPPGPSWGFIAKMGWNNIPNDALIPFRAQENVQSDQNKPDRETSTPK
jgi:hypothetical protein